MALTVGEILNMEEFREYRVLCGKKGLGREVSTVTVMDTPNIQDWLRGGEIVAGFPAATDHAACRQRGLRSVR